MTSQATHTDTLVIECPWPPKEANPNKRVHWSLAARKKSRYRRDCFNATLAVTRAKKLFDGPLLVHLMFCPPDNRKRDDDNFEAAFKSGRDGIADALGVDDNLFTVTRERGPVARHGKVIVQVRAV